MIQGKIRQSKQLKLFASVSKDVFSLLPGFAEGLTADATGLFGANTPGLVVVGFAAALAFGLLTLLFARKLDPDVCERRLDPDVWECRLDPDVCVRKLDPDVCERKLDPDVCERKLDLDDWDIILPLDTSKRLLFST